MKIALLGLPQSGKKTLYTLLTGQEVSEFKKSDEFIAGRAKLQDEKVDILTKMYNPKKTVYAETDYLLCPDIESGTGNYEWVQEARNSDLICLVVRQFVSENVYHPDGSVSPKRDQDNLLAELLLSDLDLAEKRLDRMNKEKVKKKLTQAQLLEYNTISKCKEVLENDQLLSSFELIKEEEESIQSLNFLTRKPILWCFNVDEDKINSETENNTINISALIEKDIMDIDDSDEQKEFMNEMGLTDTGVNRLNSAAYDKLGLMSFYTVGPDEVRAWTIRKETSAPKAGGKVHSDIERGFIRVEVMKYNDLINEGSEQKVKASGKFQTKGKDYVIEYGDILNFLFNV